MSDSEGDLGFTCLGKCDLLYQLHFWGYSDLLLGYICCEVCKGAAVLQGNGVETAQCFAG